MSSARTQERYRQRRTANGGKPLLVPASMARAQIERLSRAGLSTRAVAQLSGLDRTTIDRVLYKRAKAVSRETFNALLSVNLDSQNPFWVSSRSAQRRMQALMALGWSMREVDRRRGVVQGTTSRIISKEIVTRRVHVELCTIYETLCGLAPPRGSHATALRKRAARLGYAPPLAWDDIDSKWEKPKGVAA